ncbi:hypothetical protein VP01_697g9 [Puccinia sorghi]|uniref:Uncharacterized protein n=1 Tax=Puccinia sorghi TaxID=27349 RepID=A0A0L6UG46_9BASI|nr:hypothetical protein VP01_697g9 [Puccinia sorghi]
MCMSWNSPWDSHWNTVFSQFILKHWRNAHQAGTFKAFHMTPKNHQTTQFREAFFTGGPTGKNLRKDKIFVYNLSPLVQLQSHRQETLSELPILLDEMELFDIIKCTSEIKVLDQIHINKKIHLQGPQHVQAFNLEQIWKPDDTPLKNIPHNFPINCYSSGYIGTLSSLEKQILSTRPPVDFSKLLLITKSSSYTIMERSFFSN